MPREPKAARQLRAHIDVEGVLAALYKHAEAKTSGMGVIPEMMALINSIRSATDENGKLGARISPEEWLAIGEAALKLGLDLAPFLFALV